MQAPTEINPRAIRGAWWALRALRKTRRELRVRDVGSVCIAAPGDVSPAADAGVTSVLSRMRASCLERALVRQAWSAAAGRHHEVVIGVSLRNGFSAHAWLDGEAAGDGDGYVELARYPAR
jgi:hypothetical protein